MTNGPSSLPPKNDTACSADGSTALVTVAVDTPISLRRDFPEVAIPLTRTTPMGSGRWVAGEGLKGWCVDARGRDSPAENVRPEVHTVLVPWLSMPGIKPRRGGG